VLTSKRREKRNCEKHNGDSVSHFPTHEHQLGLVQDIRYGYSFIPGYGDLFIAYSSSLSGGCGIV
jgi:hypothetical protein